MTSKLIIALFIICACTPVHAQINFIQNGSFEKYSHCPTGLNEVASANHWNGIDTSWGYDSIGVPLPLCLPDYMNECSIYSAASVPVNSRFYQYPHTGSGMMQVSMYYNYGLPGYYVWDYLQQNMSGTLTAGQSYCVTFYVNMDNASSYAVNNFGAYFDDGSIDTTGACDTPQTQYTPQVLYTTVIDDTLNWIKVQGSFIADGTERYITLGNFFDTAHTLHIQVGGGYQGLYLFDDISVIPSNAAADAGPDVSIAGGDTATIGVAVNGDGMPCYWYVSGSTTPIDSGGTIKVHPLINTTYVVSMDLCGTVTYDTVNVTVHPTGINTQSVTDVRVYPNPVNKTLQVQYMPGSASAFIEIEDVVGKTMMVASLQSSNTDADVSTLPPGLYIYKIIDGGKIIKAGKVVKD